MEKPNIGRELLNVPMGEMIRDMAFAIADAQIKLDANSIEVAQMMGGLETVVGTDGNVTFKDTRVYFGSERMTVSQAVEVFNNSTDPTYKAKVKETLTTANATDTGGVMTVVTGKGNIAISIPTLVSMLELGFSPTFYQFVDTIIEVKLNISFTQSGETSASQVSTSTQKQGSLQFKLFRRPSISANRSVQTSQVNGSFSNKYSYSAEGSSLLRTKLTPIPPPAILEERIQLLMEDLRSKPATP